MDPPVLNPLLFFPPFAGRGDSDHVITLWPQNHMQQQELEAPLFKKPRTSEEGPLIPQQNSPSVLIPPAMYRPMNPPSIPLRGTNTLFFKTRLCQKFRNGSCSYGDNCNFAHGLEELRRPPLNWQEIIADERGNASELQRLQSNKICRKFYHGEFCLSGDKCTYQHVKRDTASVNMGSETAAEPGANGSRIHHSASVVGFSSTGVGKESSQRPGFWKTRICHKWEATGHCPYGDKCIFAHGYAELKKFGGHVESDEVNVGAAQAKPLPTLANNAIPVEAEPTFAHQAQKKKAFPKWVGTKKVSCIYADWIDDQVLFGRNSPTKAETCI